MTTDAAAVTPPPGADYPVRFSVDYPEGPRNRLTVLVRILLIIPIVIVFGLVSSPGGSARWNADRGADREADMRGSERMERQLGNPVFDAAGPFAQLSRSQRNAIIDAIVGIAGLALICAPAAIAALIGAGTPATAPLALPTALLLIFRRKYPRWWFDFTAQIANFGARVGAYAALQRDEYPSTDEPQGARVEIDYPEATALNRWLPIVKWLLLVPHYIVLFFLVVGLVVTTLIAWVAILITGRYPRGLFDYAVGVQCWSTRVAGYGFWLVTDRYPPFSLR